jgi:hypothetical protein
MSSRRKAVGSVMVWIEDMLELNLVEEQRPQGYAVRAFEYDGWEMTIQITSRKAPTESETP